MALKQVLIDDLLKKGFTEEQIEYIDKEVYMSFKKDNSYKILCNKKYTIIKNEFNGIKFYKIAVMKKDANGEMLYANKQVRFVNCNPPENEKTEIYINSMFEDFYYRKEDKYNAMFTLVITSYQLADKEERAERRALSEYNKSTYDESQLDDNFILREEDLIPMDDVFLD